MHPKRRKTINTGRPCCEKPPVGLRPRYISDSERLQEIKQAMNRYTKVNKSIPSEWLEEYNELCEKRGA